MRILISSHAFAPSIGGIETVSALLAEEFVRLGHEVALVTQTPAGGAERGPFRVVRQPSLGALRRLLGWCEIYWQNNLSLRTLWPVLLRPRPVVITHQGSYCRAPAGIDPGQRLKHFVVRQTSSVAISAAVAKCFATSSIVIPNPFDARLFAAGPPTEERPHELVFVGRLVSEKGLDDLLAALAQTPGRLTIVGDGPEKKPMEELARRLGLQERVDFVGPKRGPELRAILQAHKILVVPSRYEEPFGVVALEGSASGCVVIGSSGGGLPEAIGPCGVTFPNRDVNALAAAIARLLAAPNERAELLAHAPAHLARFQPSVVARSYLALFASKLR